MAVAASVVVSADVMLTDCGEDVIAAGVQLGVTVIVAASLSATPQAFVTRTQYVVVLAGVMSNVAAVALPIGAAVDPVVPTYH